jgi:ribonuclease E
VVDEAYYHSPRGSVPRIEEVLERGRPIVVQVARDAIGQKGASLTTSLSLAGRYLVLTPFDDTRGVSRKVEDEDTRRKLKSLVANLDLPEGCGLIVRTNALDQNKIAISRDLAALLRLWKQVQTAAVTGKGSRLLYSDQDLIVQALRDHLDSSIEEVLVDDDAAFQKAEAYLQAFMPRAKIRLERYEERLPLFSRFDLEPQISRIYERRVELPSGGSIVIDSTEALTAIDVNSGRSTRAATQEETAVHTNLEAAAEVARQLRLRDLGGLVVVDFIDMRASKNQRRVEKAMRDAMKADKARSTAGRISDNGLLEINRQRIQQALQVRTHRPCPTCDGTGRLASPELVTLNLLRRIETRAAGGMVQRVRISLHPELADAMQNSRRQELAELEREFDIAIEVIAAPGLHRPEEQIEWFKRERPAAPARQKPAAVALKPWDLALAAAAPALAAPAGIGGAAVGIGGGSGAGGDADGEDEEDDDGLAEAAGDRDGNRAADGATPASGRAAGRGAERRGHRAGSGGGRGRGERAAGGRRAAPKDRGGLAAAGERGARADGEGRGDGRVHGELAAGGRRGEGRGRGTARHPGAGAGGDIHPQPAAHAASHPIDSAVVAGAPHPAGEGDDAEARRGRKRRRGGRKRKRGGSGGGAGALQAGDTEPGGPPAGGAEPGGPQAGGAELGAPRAGAAEPGGEGHGTREHAAGLGREWVATPVTAVAHPEGAGDPPPHPREGSGGPNTEG